ncbi:MAG: hypothetical protein IPJ81_04790 [Chitinophagaceae bacterium]|nr:hypothetical protein [Chitinophagaceae bacterium]
MKKIKTFYIAFALLIFLNFSCRKENSIDEQALTPGTPGTWVQKNDFPANERTAAMSFVINNKAYVFGGTTNDNSTFFKDVWQYNPANDSWLKKQPLPDGKERFWTDCFLLKNRIFITGGGVSVNNQFDMLSDVLEYDIKNNKWIEQTSLPDGKNRMAHCSFVVDIKAYITAGVHDLNVNPTINFKDVWEFKL